MVVDGSAGSALSRSVARQSVLVAMVAALVDVLQLVLCGAFGAAPALATALAVAIAAADLALAGPPATVAVVAVAQVAVKLGTGLFVHHYALSARIPDVGFLVAGYRAGAWLGGAGAIAVAALLASGAASANLLAGGVVSKDWRFLMPVALASGLVPWLVGRYTAAHRAHFAELEQRERLREQERRAELERALADEREAIARDLHDVISHHVSAIGIHAGVARIALFRSESETVTRSLAAVEGSSRAALVDLRRQLDLLHGREDDGQRQPGLAAIDELVDRVREAGLALRVEISGEPPVLPDSLGVMLYRVVQELLTNALRHGRDTAVLEIAYHPTRVDIRESNPVGTVPATPGVSRGLDGMRRRVELFGGTVEYGTSATGTQWNLAVSVPIGAL
ncbi:sensor histidine kinase [Nocardia inohanensis]|uniref:sensor histidine kinase n=1 Tax=Nocardia inohanensis TaxID=209246 RepID=UPI0008372EAD|nr:histidine kinase [Nocardia inohanensis]